MKKRTTIVTGIVLAMSLLVVGSAFAHWGDGYGMRDGRGYGCWSDAERTPVDPEAMIRFRTETLSLRDQLLTKRLELKQEYGKENPDTERIAKIRKEMVDIEMSIDKIADKYDIDGPDKGRRSRGGYGYRFGECPGGRY